MTEKAHTRNTVVVGVSGASNSGKTTLVQQLVKEFHNSRVICQDTYFYEPEDARLSPLYIPELDHHNWEDYRSLEMDRMVKDVKDSISQAEQTTNSAPVVIFIDGFSLFGWKMDLYFSRFSTKPYRRPLVPLYDAKYFLMVDKEVCTERRLQRYYNPPDVPGYFDRIVWPEHLEHLNHIRDQTDIVYVNCNEGFDELYRVICKDLESLLTNNGTTCT